MPCAWSILQPAKHIQDFEVPALARLAFHQQKDMYRLARNLLLSLISGSYYNAYRHIQLVNGKVSGG